MNYVIVTCSCRLLARAGSSTSGDIRAAAETLVDSATEEAETLEVGTEEADTIVLTDLLAETNKLYQASDQAASQASVSRASDVGDSEGEAAAGLLAGHWVEFFKLHPR